MSMPTLRVLTPPGTGAIAVVELEGAGAWAAVCAKFKPVGQTKLPTAPQPGQTWFGTIGDGQFFDEVIVAIGLEESHIEIHCHGGRRVVRWIAELFPFAEQPGTPASSPWHWLERAPTARTASILLDQCHGAWDHAIRKLLADEDPGSFQLQLETLATWAVVGAHLVVPFKVAVAGAPNAGKSSLVNALVGFSRSVVDAQAGTTRDVVTTSIALDGWPMELIDTAGLRDAQETIEVEGIARARMAATTADLVLHVLDVSVPTTVLPSPSPKTIVVLNKTDLPRAWDTALFPDAHSVIATTNAGVDELGRAIVARFIPNSPPPGTAVPYTPALAELVLEAILLTRANQIAKARALLAKAYNCV